MSKIDQDHNYYKNVLSSSDPGADYSVLSDCCVNIKNLNIRYDVIMQKNLQGDVYYNIFIHKSSPIEPVCDHIKKNKVLRYNQKKTKTIIFLIKKKKPSMNKVIDLLKPKQTFFVEEILRKAGERTAEFQKGKWNNPEPFIFPKMKVFEINERADELKKEKEEPFEKIYKSKEEFQNEFLDKWYADEESSILVLVGDGGVGKTTMARVLGNYLLDKEEISSKIFIDSIKARKYLGRREMETETINLYDLYKASLFEGNRLNDFLFKQNLDAGNFFIIIDGIDELISKVPHFDIELFLKSIDESSWQVKGAKIIITCRTHFWKKEMSENYIIRNVEILPFTLDMTEEFFSKTFSQETKKSEAIGLAKDFHTVDSGNTVYQPFALDIIKSIVMSKGHKTNSYGKEQTKLLNNDLALDHIIGRICQRENYLNDEVRVLELDIDDQVKILQSLALIHNGEIKIDDLKGLFKNTLTKDRKLKIQNTLLEAFKTHPLISYNEGDDILRFKYDFFIDFFKGLYLSNYLISDLNPLDKESLVRVCEDCKHGSNLLGDIKKRIEKADSWNDESKYRVQYLIEYIAKKIESNDGKTNKTALSGIFNLIITINHHMRNNNTHDNTKLIKHIYSSTDPISRKKTIRHLWIEKLNVPTKFDFSGLIMEHCGFIEYESFWDCTFDENTIIYHSEFEDLGRRKSKEEIKLKRENVKLCDEDDSFRSTLDRNKEKSEKRKGDLYKFSKKCLRFFVNDGQFLKRVLDGSKNQSFKPHYNKEKRNASINLDFKDFMKIAEDSELLEIIPERTRGGDKVRIVKHNQNEWQKFLESDLTSKSIDDFVNKLHEHTTN